MAALPGFDLLVAGLRAAAEETRLRILALCVTQDLSVTDLTEILGQSQPRLSRHLKILVEAGLLNRFREGSNVFFKVAGQGSGALTARYVLRLVRPDDPTFALDRARLADVLAERECRARAFFTLVAEDWDRIRALHVPEAEVEAALLALRPAGRMGRFLDIGTGSGRMLELFAPYTEEAIGIDEARAMLQVARARIVGARLENVVVRQANLYDIPLPVASVDFAVLHMVLHYTEAPDQALAEAARVLAPDGILAVVDFAPHRLEALRSEGHHRRLGFADSEVQSWLSAAGLSPQSPMHLVGDPLTVTLWAGRKRAPI